MKLKARVSIHTKKQVFAPGDVFVAERHIETEEEARSLIDRGFAELLPADPAPAGIAAGVASGPSPLPARRRNVTQQAVLIPTSEPALAPAGEIGEPALAPAGEIGEVPAEAAG